MVVYRVCDGSRGRPRSIRRLPGCAWGRVGSSGGASRESATVDTRQRVVGVLGYYQVVAMAVVEVVVVVMVVVVAVVVVVVWGASRRAQTESLRHGTGPHTAASPNMDGVYCAEGCDGQPTVTL